MNYKGFLKNIKKGDLTTITEDNIFVIENPNSGATGTFTTVDSKTVTVTNGLITSIV